MVSNYHTNITLHPKVLPKKPAKENDFLLLPHTSGFLISGTFAKNQKARTGTVPAPAAIWLNHRTDMGFSPDRKGDLHVSSRDYCLTF